jgi:ribosomal protein S18 acetylase RimI-like enzyme
MLQLDLPPYRVSYLEHRDVPLLQELYERCSDFQELTEGMPRVPGAAEHLLTALPPGKSPADKHVLGLHSPQGELLGVLDLIRDYPDAGEWWVGLLMLDPRARGGGVGTRLLRATERVIAAAGGASIYLCVLEHNTAAERFWRRMGFTELRRQPHTSMSGKASRVIVMRHDLT